MNQCRTCYPCSTFIIHLLNVSNLPIQCAQSTHPLWDWTFCGITISLNQILVFSYHFCYLFYGKIYRGLHFKIIVSWVLNLLNLKLGSKN